MGGKVCEESEIRTLTHRVNGIEKKGGELSTTGLVGGRERIE